MGSPARFVCALAVASGAAILYEARGTIEGRVSDTPKGERGFGYDPIFFYPPLGRTLAELDETRRRRSAIAASIPPAPGSPGHAPDVGLAMKPASNPPPSPETAGVRLDVWLDVACLFKTRSEAQKACRGGKVDVNGQSGKPHRALHVGDELRITRAAGRRSR